MRFKTITLFSLFAAFGLLLTVPAGAQDQTPFFSEDFDGGLPADWSSLEIVGDGSPTAVWFHTTVGPTGDFALDPLASTTSDNGWMIFDSDLNCNLDAQDAWLISPAIDASAQSEVYLRFQTLYRRFNDLALVRVGTNLNDLDSWSEYDVFPGLSNNDFGGILEDNPELNPQIIILDLTEDMAGESEVYFAFQFLSDMTTVQAGDPGCAYSWQVDDVGLFDTNPLPANDLTASSPAYGPHFATPESQVDTIAFAFTVRNAGLADQTNLTFLVTVEGDGGQFFVTEETMDVLPAGVADTIFFEETYLPEGLGAYTVTYTVSQDEDDARPDNNLVQAEFVVTEDLFSNDNGAFVNATRPGGLTEETFQIGCYYPPTAGGYEAFQIDFSMASNDDVHIGETVTVWLYQFIDDGTGEINDLTMVPVGAGTYTFGDDDTNFNVFTADIEPLLGSGEGVELEEGADYFAMVELNSETMFFTYTENEYPYGQLSLIGRAGADDWFTGFIGGGITPVVRMRIRPIGGSSVSGVELLDAAVKTFPNPATDLLNARVELPEVAGQLQVRIIDVYGQTHLAQTYENFLQDNFEFDTSRLPAGTYYLHLETEQGVKTEKIVIQR